ncbi:hypothetical protein RUND412_002951 [Rhizina undulata]
MDAYPAEFVTHEAPLLLLSGLAPPEKCCETSDYPLLENGTLVACGLPSITIAKTADQLLEAFLKRDVSGIWNRNESRGVKGVHSAFRIRSVGRNYILPPRKALPPSLGTPDSPVDGPPTRALHSPISPLSPSSPLYPDGVISHLWLRKHQMLIPAVFIAFHELFTASNDPNLLNLKDNELITSINHQRRAFSPINGSSSTSTSIGNDDIRSSGYRTKFVVVLLSEKSILSSPQIDERISYIRWSTNLTSNMTYYFLPANSSLVEINTFITNVLSVLSAGAIEYYRDLAKHTRRKRNKGSIPPPTIPSSRALSTQAWNLRYEFKLGIFAEFRQEMDVAARNYETAYDKLLTEVFETTTSWSERWTEARLLADILALRIIRCYLWGEQYTAAKRRFNLHVQLMKGLIDRKGRGTETYGFAAWMSRWNRCLGELLRAGNLPAAQSMSVPNTPRSPILVPGIDQFDASSQNLPIYALPEKSIPAGECLGPHEYLHHAGFYFLQAAEYAARRKRFANGISEEDSPDSQDLYLCPPPQEEITKVDHVGIQISLLLLARREFELRGQKRMADSIAYRLSKLKMENAGENPEFWAEALRELRSVAGIYRKEGWWGILQNVLFDIITCARRTGDGGSLVLAELELLCKDAFTVREGWKYNLPAALAGIETVKVKPTMVVRAGDIVSFLTATYAFQTPTVHVGDTLLSQLAITSHAHPSSAPLTFTELKLTYEGSIKTISLKHSPSSTPSSSSSKHFIDLKNAIHEQILNPDDPLPSPGSQKSFLVGETNLTFSPGETKILEFATILREAGEARALCATFLMETEGFDLDYMVMLEEDVDEASKVLTLPRRKSSTPNGGTAIWWIPSPGPEPELKKRPIRSLEPGRIKILPRPPKLELAAKSDFGKAYVDETIRLELELINGEDEAAVVGVGIKILGWPEEVVPNIQFISEENYEPEEVTPSLYPLGTLAPGQKITRTVVLPAPKIPADCTLEITANYCLVSDLDTRIIKSTAKDLIIVSPFQIAYDFSPRVHPEKWPGYFDIDDEVFDAVGKDEELGKAKRLMGLKQRWCLTARILNVGDGEIVLEGLELPVVAVGNGVGAEVVEVTGRGVVLQPNVPVSITFQIDIQKPTLEDRRATSIDVLLNLSWRRTSSPSSSTPSPTTRTTLTPPRLPIPAFEPRLLLTSSPIPSTPTSTSKIVSLTYTLENPTTYFLTFQLQMDANENYAFSGPKQVVMQLPPVQRVEVKYQLVVVKSGWVMPGLRVVDRWFNKVLRCSPGGEGVVVRGGGVGVWVE